MYQNYIFDLYGTLVDISTDENSAKLWKKTTEEYKRNGAVYTPQELQQKYYSYIRKEKYKVKLIHPFYQNIDIDLLKVFKKLYCKKGVKPTTAVLNDTAWHFRQNSTLYLKIFDGAEDLLKSLKENNKQVYLLSNAQSCFTLNELKSFDILKYFDGVFISSEHLCSKPSKQYFEKLIKTYSLEKSKTIMIGNDYMSDIGGANKVGIDSLYIYQKGCSPDIPKKEIPAKYKIFDGNVWKIKEYILKP